MRTKFLILILLLKFNILLYSQDERKWEVYPDIFFSTGQLTSPIAFAIGTNIYCGGGLYGVNNLGGNSIEVYNILQKRIVTTIGTPYGNTAYAVTFTINGKGYVCMGSKLSPSERIVKQLWELDTASNIWTRKADFPGNLKRNAFYEQMRLVSIEAAHFTKAINTNGINWKVLPDHGRTGDAVTPFPVTAKQQKAGGNAPHLQYEVYTYSSGEFKINA